MRKEENVKTMLGGGKYYLSVKYYLSNHHRYTLECVKRRLFIPDESLKPVEQVIRLSGCEVPKLYWKANSMTC